MLTYVFGEQFFRINSMVRTYQLSTEMDIQRHFVKVNFMAQVPNMGGTTQKLKIKFTITNLSYYTYMQWYM